MTKAPAPCMDCTKPPMKGYRRCYFHWVAKQDILVQASEAAGRFARAQQREGYVFRHRVQAREGYHWCSGCQSMIPLHYVSGSRCKACNRAAARASHVQNTYGLSGQEELELQRWQSNRCFICGASARTRQLAVDHDHKTGRVRGLLCSDRDHGCNWLLRRLLDDLDAAERLVAYVEGHPIDRMRRGEPPWSWTAAPPVDDAAAVPF